MNEPNIFAEFADESRLDFNQDSGGVAHAEVEEPRSLFNQRKPAYALKAERPEHRAIVMMKASAMTNVEIAASIGWTPVAVGYVVKQPWAVKQILEEIERAGREPVMQLLKVSAMEAAQRLVGIAETAENDETRRKANNDILDRVFGKSNQAITVTTKDPNSMTDAELLAIATKAKTN